MTFKVQLIRLGDARRLTQAGGLPIDPEDGTPLRYQQV